MRRGAERSCWCLPGRFFSWPSLTIITLALHMWRWRPPRCGGFSLPRLVATAFVPDREAGGAMAERAGGRRDRRRGIRSVEGQAQASYRGRRLRFCHPRRRRRRVVLHDARPWRGEARRSAACEAAVLPRSARHDGRPGRGARRARATPRQGRARGSSAITSSPTCRASPTCSRPTCANCGHPISTVRPGCFASRKN